jgi:predicted pyridoxine 5'-phosphate oxidase superfamily flavin-nucleotide-binding protein
MADSPFHEGERLLQERLGVRDQIERVGSRVIRDYMPDEHRTFFAHLPWILVGSIDAQGRPWASLLAGEPGFVTSPDARTLVLAAVPIAGDVLRDHLRVGAPLGLLGIELHTRRRNRLNGTIAEASAGRIVVRVDQSFGNCPKYINRKTLARRRGGEAPRVPVVRAALDARGREIVANADTLFIASSHLPAGARERSNGVDVSHRGGAPGFVRVEADGSLTIPDYLGNFLFNTLGNVQRDRRAGLLFVDFASGDVLQLTGDAWIDWDAPEIAATAGVQRLLRVRPAEVRLLGGAFPFTAEVIDSAPQLDSIDSIGRTS